MIHKLKEIFIRFKIWCTPYRKRLSANYKYGIVIHAIGKVFKHINIFSKYKIVIQRKPEKHNVGDGGIYAFIYDLELWEICGAHDNEVWNQYDSPDINHYNWEKLERDIKKYGVLDYIEVYPCLKESLGVRGKKCRYCAGNGNHRLSVLKKLYGPNYKITVKLELDKQDYYEWNDRLITK